MRELLEADSPSFSYFNLIVPALVIGTGIFRGCKYFFPTSKDELEKVHLKEKKEKKPPTRGKPISMFD